MGETIFGDADTRPSARRIVRPREELRAHAQAENCTPAQLALAWLLAQKPFVVPIPGTSHVRRLEENAAAAALSLSADTTEVLAHVFAPGAAAGLHYPESHLARLGI
jgi:aryl-alcohol dehydrogenase-like predicted oxidoreductase